MIVLVVHDVLVHELVELVKVEKRNHRVAVMFRVEIGVPKERANNNVGPNAASVAKTVAVFGHFAVGVLEVANEVDAGVAAQDGQDPPKDEALKALLGLPKRQQHTSVAGQLFEGRPLESLHYTALGAVGPILEAPTDTAVVNSNTGRRVEDPSGTLHEGGLHVKEHEEVCHAVLRHVAKAWVLELLSAKVAGELGVLVNVVGVSVVLLVHNALVRTKLKTKDACQKEADVIDPLRLEGISMQKLVLAGKGEALELKAVEKVHGQKERELESGETLIVERKDIHLVDDKCRGCHGGQVGEEAFQAFVVGLAHELDQDPVVKNAVTLLALAVLDIGPVFVVAIDLGEAISIGLLIKHVGQCVLVLEDLGLVEGRSRRWSSVWSHGSSWKSV